MRPKRDKRNRPARATTERRGRRRGRWLQWTKRLLVGGAALSLAGIGGLAGVLWYYGRDLPPVDALHSYEPPQTTRVVDRNGELVGEIFTERRTVVPMDRIPRWLVLSVLAAEDADFYEHEGLDYPGLTRALVRAVLSGSQPRGTSTITQQVVKLMLLTPEQTVARKARELILARRIEQELTKDEILHLYLNHINFGHGRYGVQEAARYYFDKDVEDLTLAEASLIAGVPQSPTRLSPRAHPEAARRRQRFVLDQLERKRAERWPDLDLALVAEAREAEPRLAPVPQVSESAPEIVVIARRVLQEQVGEADFARGGFTVHTTIDVELQRQAREALRSHLAALDERHGYRGPLTVPRRRRRRPRPLPPVDELRIGPTYDAVVTGADDEAGVLLLDVGGHEAIAPLPARHNPDELPPTEFAEENARVRVSIRRLADEDEDDDRAEAALELGPEGAVVVIEPRSRDVLALVGSYEPVTGLNRAVQSVRQPGSTFKPIVYALGIRTRRFTPASLVIDAPAVYEQWRPSNFETWDYEGTLRLREALARSVNLVAIRVIDEVTPQETVAFATQLGISTELEPSLGLALGASDVRPVELVNAYATFAAGGRWEPYRLIARIDGPQGRSVPLPEREHARDVMTPAEAYVTTSMLESVIRGGTGSAARQLGRPAAGKTGTSNDARDAWFVGYTPSVVAGVWVGFDDNRPLGRRESGGRAALPVWIDVVRAAEGDRPAVEFPVPSGVVTAEIDPESGLLAWEGMESPLTEVFLEGTVPTETARPPDVADPSTFLMEQFGGGPTDSAPDDTAPADPSEPE